MRWKLTIEYDGTGFVGWQRQKNGLSVQGVLEAALLSLSGEVVTVTGAGRTDAGVHAAGQVAHFDLTRPMTPGRLCDALNALVRPHAVSVLRAEETPPEFHARFDAIARTYRYRILARRSPPALERHQVWHVSSALDTAAMDESAKALLGKHDFTTFRAVHCQAKSPVKTLDRLDVVAQGAEILIWAKARSFLHNQVRSMVGSLKLVGEGKWAAQDLAHALEARNRAACGPVAPPEGLCLMTVDYPSDESV